MKRFTLFLCMVIFSLCLIGVADSTPIPLTDTILFTETGPVENLVSYGGDSACELEGCYDWVKWTHYFTFDPLAEEVLSGTLTLSLRDDECDWFELAIGWAEDGTWGFGEVDTGDYDYEVKASYLMDGVFTVTLVSLCGDFFIDKSVLDMTYKPVSSPVPEPATILLLGCGLIGMAGFSRKKLLKK